MSRKNYNQITKAKNITKFHTCYAIAYLIGYNCFSINFKGERMLIDLFTDYIRNKKDLREYVERRKTIKERGEFNDQKLIRIQENLERLQKENPDIYNKMFEVLEDVFRRDQGNYVEYSLDFAREILQMFRGKSLESIYENYKAILDHKYQTVC